MKKNTLLAAFLLLTIALHAQDKHPKYLIECAIGPSFPIGKFSATTYKDDNEVPGFAKTGLGAQLSLGYYLNQSIGVMLLSGYTVHARDEKSFKNNIESSSTLTVTEMDLESWQTLKLMAGGFGVTPLTAGSELVLRTKLTAGVAKTAVPKTTWSGFGPGYTAGGHGDKTSLPWSFCYQVSLALEYKLNRNLHVLLDISSFNTTAQKEFTYPYTPSPTITVKNKYKQATVNALLGIGMSF